MGGTATPELAAAVAEAGALGMVAMPMVEPDAVVTALEHLSGQTSGVFGINFLMPFVDRDVVAAAASRVRVVEFFYGDPDPSFGGAGSFRGRPRELAGGIGRRSPGCA